MIAIPINTWVWGPAAQVVGIVGGVVLQAGLVGASLWRAWGPKRALGMVLLIAAPAWGAEALGVATGFPFGRYHYTAALQPQLLDVPLLIPLAWLMMLPPAWSVAHSLAGRIEGAFFSRRPSPWRKTVLAILLSALAFTAWDLFLDPQMTAAGLWVWHDPSGGYFGIPWVNFAGWLLVSLAITALAQVIPAARGAELDLGLLKGVYLATWALETIGLYLFWALPGPAVVGGVGMGLFAGYCAWELWAGKRSR